MSEFEKVFVVKAVTVFLEGRFSVEMPSTAIIMFRLRLSSSTSFHASVYVCAYAAFSYSVRIHACASAPSLRLCLSSVCVFVTASVGYGSASALLFLALQPL